MIRKYIKVKEANGNECYYTENSNGYPCHYSSPHGCVAFESESEAKKYIKARPRLSEATIVDFDAEADAEENDKTAKEAEAAVLAEQKEVEELETLSATELRAKAYELLAQAKELEKET